MNDSSSRIVVSGLGVVSCHGSTLDEHRKAIVDDECELTEVDRSAGYHRRHGSRFAALVDPACYREVLPPLKARRMSPPSRFAMVAAMRALDDAGLGSDSFRAEGSGLTAVVLGTSYGPSSYTERILRQILLESPQAASPMLFTESVANAPAAQVALALGCKGPNITVTQREASALLAVAEGAWLIRSGKAERALVGGVEEINPLLHSILDRFGALAGSRSSKEGRSSEQALPADRRRNGFNAAEGAAVLVLEREARVVDRGGQVRAAVGPCARAFDAHAPATGWSSEAPAVFARLQSEWQRQGWKLDDLVGIVSGANGSRSLDRFEAWLLRQTACSEASADFSSGDLPSSHQPLPVALPKRALGEQGIASLVGALLQMEGVGSAAKDSDFELDPELLLQPNKTTSVSGQYLLSACAAGGTCCWLGLESA